VHYSIFDSMVEKYMVTCSRYIVARIFESVVVVAEVYEYPDLLLSMGILVTQRLSDHKVHGKKSPANHGFTP